MTEEIEMGDNNKNILKIKNSKSDGSKKIIKKLVKLKKKKK